MAGIEFGRDKSKNLNILSTWMNSQNKRTIAVLLARSTFRELTELLEPHGIQTETEIAHREKARLIALRMVCAIASLDKIPEELESIKFWAIHGVTELERLGFYKAGLELIERLTNAVISIGSSQWKKVILGSLQSFETRFFSSSDHPTLTINGEDVTIAGNPITFSKDEEERTHTLTKLDMAFGVPRWQDLQNDIWFIDENGGGWKELLEQPLFWEPPHFEGEFINPASFSDLETPPWKTEILDSQGNFVGWAHFDFSKVDDLILHGDKTGKTLASYLRELYIGKKRSDSEWEMLKEIALIDDAIWEEGEVVDGVQLEPAAAISRRIGLIEGEDAPKKPSDISREIEDGQYDSSITIQLGTIKNIFPNAEMKNLIGIKRNFEPDVIFQNNITQLFEASDKNARQKGMEYISLRLDRVEYKSGSLEILAGVSIVIGAYWLFTKDYVKVKEGVREQIKDVKGIANFLKDEIGKRIAKDDELPKEQLLIEFREEKDILDELEKKTRQSKNSTD